MILFKSVHTTQIMMNVQTTSLLVTVDNVFLSMTGVTTLTTVEMTAMKEDVV